MKKISFTFTLIFLFSSCAPATTAVPPTERPTTTSTATIIPTSTNTPTPQPTFTPTFTPTPTLIPRTPITAENAKDIQLLNQISGLSGSDIAWSPDGKLLALARDNEIILFDSNTLQILSSIPTDYTFHMTIHPSSHVKFSYDGTRILIGGLENGEGSGQVFDVDSGQEISKFKTLDEVTEFCAPGNVLTSYEGNFGYPIFCLSPEKSNLVYYGNTLALSPDNVYGAMIAGYSMELVKFDDTGSRQSVWYSPRNYPWGDYAESADFSPSGSTVAVGFYEGDIHLYDVKSGQEKYFLVAGLYISGLSFSPDGNRLAYASRTGSGIIDLRSGNKVTELGGTSPGSISDIEFSPDGRWLATANTADNFMLWDVGSGELHYQLPVRSNSKVLKTTGDVICQTWAAYFAFSPDGQRIALTRNGFLQMVELNSHQVLYKRHIEEANSIAFSPDGKFLATGTSFDVGGKDTLPEFAWVQVYDASNGSILHTLRGVPGTSKFSGDWHYNCIVDMAFTPDNRTLAVADMDSIRFWDMQSGEQIWQYFDPKMNRISDIEISADGSMLATSGKGKIWPFKDGQISQYPIQAWNNLRSSHLSPDGSLIGFVVYKDGTSLLELWVITSKTKVFSDVIKDFSRLHNLPGYRMDFTNDGNLLALGSEDGVISIYGLKP